MFIFTSRTIPLDFTHRRGPVSVGFSILSFPHYGGNCITRLMIMYCRPTNLNAMYRRTGAGVFYPFSMHIFPAHVTVCGSLSYRQ
ncbi:hypothetical protein FB451DRAFT_354963 [Mycena latifolia]|nr:hypothetical protein FB451DRAFT_354963 [Mycena latifolia]